MTTETKSQSQLLEDSFCLFCNEPGDFEPVPPPFDNVALICHNPDCYVNDSIPAKAGRGE